MRTTAGTAFRDRRRTLQVAAAALGSLLVGGCSIGVPDPTAPEPAATTPAGLATPTITPGHDAEAVAAQDLPFAAGGTLAPGVPVGLSGGLEEAPGWKILSRDVAGESRYAKADGCVVAARGSTNQDALIRGDDRESTVALFQYLDPSILPAYLKTETLRWGRGGQAGGDSEGPGRKVEVLALEQAAEQAAPPAGRATAVLARLFAAAGSSIYVSVSCPGPDALAAARADVARFLPVLPPSN
ncbi:hypothetical protein [Pseudarthrobacter sp. NamE5]|uniref:hypothetical protein n=1 Tax=Pseudarthrobacter sp. NamE5 TaxID=2576839 RepID=UPI00110AF371|nr:hypothetical protein [Pseudarthrobacter sp. NamE5]TLM86818.1 hypothetical protein FDW84_05985 [Pseudarthrobacter sp. NamE5]